jgi:hypothetical protein
MRILATAAAAAIGAATLVLVPASADAAPLCVSRSEYRHVHNGQSQAQVTRIFHGQHGKVTYTSSYSTSRTYKGCGSRWASVDVSFRKPFSGPHQGHKVVDYKSAYWG